MHIRVQTLFDSIFSQSTNSRLVLIVLIMSAFRGLHDDFPMETRCSLLSLICLSASV